VKAVPERPSRLPDPRPGSPGSAQGRSVPWRLLSSGAALAGVAAAAVAWTRLRRAPAETPETRRAGLTVLRTRAGPHAIFARAATGRTGSASGPTRPGSARGDPRAAPTGTGPGPAPTTLPHA